MEIYKHKQIGYVITISLLFSLFFLLSISIIISSMNHKDITISLVILSFASLIILFSLLTFYSLMVIITDDGVLLIKFGIGIINKKIILKDVHFCQKVNNSWYNGWGIRKIQNGWVFNVSGYLAVEIMLKNGVVYRIGTDEPDKLESVINEFIIK